MNLNKFANYILRYDDYKPTHIIIRPSNSENYKEENDYEYYSIVGVLINGIKYRTGWTINDIFIPNVKSNSFELKNKINKIIIEFVKKKNKIKTIYNYLVLFNNWGLNNDVSTKIIKFIF